MNSTAVHPAFAVDYARARAVEASRDAQRRQRARLLRPADLAPTPRRRRFSRPLLGLRPLHGG